MHAQVLDDLILLAKFLVDRLDLLQAVQVAAGPGKLKVDRIQPRRSCAYLPLTDVAPQRQADDQNPRRPELPRHETAAAQQQRIPGWQEFRLTHGTPPPSRLYSRPELSIPLRFL